MINYISVQYEQQLEGWRRRKGGEGGMFIVIRNGNVAAPMGRYDEVDKEYNGETRLPSSPETLVSRTRER